MTMQSAINVGAIERELTSLWQQASEDDDGGIMRASTLNLLVFVTSQTEAALLDETLTDVTSTHPSRAILIVADGSSQDSSLVAQVLPHATLPTRHQAVAASRSQSSRLVLKWPNDQRGGPLLVSDLHGLSMGCAVPG